MHRSGSDWEAVTAAVAIQGDIQGDSGNSTRAAHHDITNDTTGHKAAACTEKRQFDGGAL